MSRSYTPLPQLPSRRVAGRLYLLTLGGGKPHSEFAHAIYFPPWEGQRHIYAENLLLVSDWRFANSDETEVQTAYRPACENSFRLFIFLVVSHSLSNKFIVFPFISTSWTPDSC
jgi:hypothetical protein